MEINGMAFPTTDDWLPELNLQGHCLNCPQFYTKLIFVTPTGSLPCTSTDEKSNVRLLFLHYMCLSKSCDHTFLHWHLKAVMHLLIFWRPVLCSLHFAKQHRIPINASHPLKENNIIGSFPSKYCQKKPQKTFKCNRKNISTHKKNLKGNPRINEISLRNLRLCKEESAYPLQERDDVFLAHKMHCRF